MWMCCFTASTDIGLHYKLPFLRRLVGCLQLCSLLLYSLSHIHCLRDLEGCLSVIMIYDSSLFAVLKWRLFTYYILYDCNKSRHLKTESFLLLFLTAIHFSGLVLPWPSSGSVVSSCWDCIIIWSVFVHLSYLRLIHWRCMTALSRDVWHLFLGLVANCGSRRSCSPDSIALDSIRTQIIVLVVLLGFSRRSYSMLVCPYIRSDEQWIEVLTWLAFTWLPGSNIFCPDRGEANKP